jgi:hypothetical protein
MHGRLYEKTVSGRLARSALRFGKPVRNAAQPGKARTIVFPVSRPETPVRQSGENQPPETAMNNTYPPDRLVFIALVLGALVANLPW